MNKPNPDKPTIEECLADVKFVDRFLSKFDIPDDYANECWVWKYKLSSNGYGGITWYNRGTSHKYLAHVVSYVYYKTSIDANCCLDHLCRNQLCISPFCLEQVSPRENVIRGIGLSAMNAKKTHCIRGHILDEENTRIRDQKGRPRRDCRVCDRLRYTLRRKRALRARHPPPIY